MNRITVMATTMFATLTLAATAAAGAESHYGSVGIYGNAWLNYALKQPKVFDVHVPGNTKRHPNRSPRIAPHLGRGNERVPDAQFFETGDQRGAREGVRRCATSHTKARLRPS
jgi:hypothetical protein